MVGIARERERGVKDILSRSEEGREGNVECRGMCWTREKGKMRDNFSVHWENGGEIESEEEGGRRRLVEIGSHGVSRGHGWGERSRRR